MIKRGRRVGMVMCIALTLGCGILLTGCANQSGESAEPRMLDVYFLNVGKADCALIGFGDDWIIVDAGLEETSEYVVQFMRGKGVKSLALAVATHPDKDHIGGMASILRGFEVRQLAESPMRDHNKPSIAMRGALTDTGTPSNTMRAGDRITLGGLTITAIAPGADALALGDTNEASLVLMLEYGSTRILMAADALSDSESEMLANYNDLRADVLKVGHHGSNEATTQAFLEAVKPSIAVISTGERIDGKDGKTLPNAKTLARLEAIGAVVYRTDIDGTIHIQSDGKTVRVVQAAVE